MPDVVEPFNELHFRRLIAWILTIVGLPLVAYIGTLGGDQVELSTALLGMLVFVLVIAVVGGWLVGAVAAVGGSLLVNWFFVEPLHTFSISDTEHLIGLVVFVAAAITVGSLVDFATRRAAEAKVARKEAELLARSTGTLAADPDPLASLLEMIHQSFGLDAVRLSSLGDDAAAATVVAGQPSGEPAASIVVRPIGAHGAQRLDLYGHALSDEDERVLRVLVDQVAVAAESRRLADQASAAKMLADIDAVRTALLRAVSHDLRTPLASIKAMVSGLRDPSVEWERDQIETALATVEEETDRLDQLVGNLLDASRLESGALAVDIRATAVNELVAGALDGLGHDADRVTVDVPDTVPAVWCDPVLLERSLANVIMNALRHAPLADVVVSAAVVEDRVHFAVADRGRGIPSADRERVVAPFQRLGDHRASDGTGLGLSIAKGFVEAMDGRFVLDDTPGGGLTVRIELPLADGSGVAR